MSATEAATSPGNDLPDPPSAGERDSAPRRTSALPVKRAQILKRLVTDSTEYEEEEEEEPSFDERHSICDSSTLGMLTKPSSVAPKHPPNLLGSSCGDPAKGSPPQAWKSAPSWQRVKVEVDMVALSRVDDDDGDDGDDDEEGGTESEFKSRGPLLHPEYPPRGVKYVALSPETSGEPPGMPPGSAGETSAVAPPGEHPPGTACHFAERAPTPAFAATPEEQGGAAARAQAPGGPAQETRGAARRAGGRETDHPISPLD